MVPIHDPIGRGRQAWEAACLLTAGGLLVWLGLRLVAAPWDRPWLAIPILVLGALTADLVSGLVHWTADTWGSESMPILGRRFVRPFRVHHVNPDDFLRRRFLDTNGDVAMIVVPILLAACWLPLEPLWGRLVGVFLLAFAATGLPTNQVHQWAHMPSPPSWVRWLQEHGCILSRRDHGRHHRAPYGQHYCIATGWLNPLLERARFFRRLETVVTWMTGLSPRQDDHDFQQSVERERAASPPAGVVRP